MVGGVVCGVIRCVICCVISDPALDKDPPLRPGRFCVPRRFCSAG